MPILMKTLQSWLIGGLILGICSVASAQIRTLRPDLGPQEEIPNQATISELEQKFPVLQPTKKPLLLRPARSTLVIKGLYRLFKLNNMK